MTQLILFNKPYGVLTQFTDHENGRATLADYIDLPGFYAAGRLDRDSEGLLLLTDHGPLNAQIAHPKYKKAKTYLVQVDGDLTDEALEALRTGVELKDGMTLPARVRRIDEPVSLWDRDPPVRYRKAIPTSWVELSITEGKNRQVRRMTAAVGFPTLRLIRHAIGDWTLDGLAPGEWKVIEVDAPPVTHRRLSPRYSKSPKREEHSVTDVAVTDQEALPKPRSARRKGGYKPVRQYSKTQNIKEPSSKDGGKPAMAKSGRRSRSRPNKG